jgi:O-antigen ligase
VPDRKRRANKRRAAEPVEGKAQETAHSLARRVDQIAFGLLLIGTGLAPLAPTFEATPVLRLLVQMFFIMSAGMWIISMSLEGSLRLRRTGLGKYLLLLFAALVAATVNATYKYPSVLTLFGWAAGFSGFLYVLNQCRGRYRRLILLLVICAGAFAVCLHGLHQLVVELPEARKIFGANPERVMKMLGLSRDAAFDLQGRMEKDRIFSTFLLPNSLAGYLVLVLPMVIGLALDRWYSGAEPGRRFIPRALLVLPFVLALYFTKSKGGWLALGISAAVFILWSFRDVIRRKWKESLSTAAAILIVVAIAQFSGLLVPLRDYAGSSSVRYGYWRAAAKICSEDPVFGVGLDNFADYYAIHKAPEDQEAKRAHNDYLQLAAETGLVGIGAYLLFWLMFWKRMICRKGEPLWPSDQKTFLNRGDLLALAALGGLIFCLEVFCGGTLRSARGFWGWQWPMALAFAWIVFATAWAPTISDATLTRDSYTSIGIAAGLAGFLAHSVVDLDHYVGGILDTAWIMMALLASSRFAEEAESDWVRPLKSPGRLGTLAVGIGGLLLLFYGFVLPAADSEVRRSRALDPESRDTIEWRRRDLEQAVASNPLDAENHVALADLYLDMWLAGKQSIGAHSTFSLAVWHIQQKAIELDPARAEYHSRLGRLREIRWLTSRSSSDYQDALNAYSEAEKLFPSNPDMALNLGRLYDLGGRHDMALGKYIRARNVSLEHYHIPRKFNREELEELDARIEHLKTSNTQHVPPPPLDFSQPRLLGWPRGTPVPPVFRPGAGFQRPPPVRNE